MREPEAIIEWLTSADAEVALSFALARTMPKFIQMARSGETPALNPTAKLILEDLVTVVRTASS